VEQGLVPFAQPTLSNGKCAWQTEEEERAQRQAAVEGQLKVLRSQLPKLLCRLAKIKDPRNPETSKHKLTVLLLYGLRELAEFESFVYQLASRREANREMTRPVFTENLRLLFPELETMPHHDTLNRLLSRIEVEKIEETQVELVKDFLRNKKFQRYLTGKHYLVAIDGTQKFSRDYRWAEECQERRVRGAGGEGVPAREGSGELADLEYYVYVLEAALIFPNGMTLPLLSEFLRYPDGDVAAAKQDCELKAFKRLAARLKESFPRLPLLLVLDGLYPSDSWSPHGPVLALSRQYNWQYMIVLQDSNSASSQSLPSVWEEAEGLRKLSSSGELLEFEDTLKQKGGDRRQHFWWANDIEYDYESEGKRKTEKVHVVVCEETWEAVDPKTNQIVAKHSRHAWLSSRPLNRQNVHERCNLMARHRWKLENSNSASSPSPGGEASGISL